jgi:hypothetical protein
MGVQRLIGRTETQRFPARIIQFSNANPLNRRRR